MRTGRIISGAGHAVLILFVLFAGEFTAAPLPPVVTAEVSLISAEEFAALTRPDAGPAVSTETPEASAPEAEATPPAPEPTSPPDTAAPAAAPPAPRPPEARPEAPAPSAPEAEVAVLVPPTPSPPLPAENAAELGEPTPLEAPRVAPDPAPPAPPEVETAPEVVEDVAPVPDEAAEVPVEDVSPAAPPEATTEIVTEAETPASRAPGTSERPRARPEPPRQVAALPELETPPESPPEAEPEPEPEPEAPAEPASDPTAEAIAAALAAAQSAPAEETAPDPGPAAGPPMTAGEKNALRVAVQRCWNVGSLSSDALATTIVVAVEMTRDARPAEGSIRMIGFEGGPESAAQQAFEAARRAILRCGANGYDLPVEKYGQWAEIEMTFNPEGMRLR